MADKYRRGAIAALAILLTFAALLTLFAGVMEGLLAAWVNYHRPSIVGDYILIGFVFLVRTGVVPSLVLRKLKIRPLATYAVVGVLSGILATYCWYFAFAIYDSLWSWVHIVNAPDGSGYDRTPPFFNILSAAYCYAPHLFRSGVWPPSIAEIAIGAGCGGLFWLIAVHRWRKPKQ